MADRDMQRIRKICEDSGGRSLFFEKGTSGYEESIHHWLDSSSEEAAAAVRPGSEEDLSAIMKVLANKNLLFGIKGGGHATRPGMSATTGLQIDMCLFDDVRYDSNSKKVEVGAGCVWEDVYDKVLKHCRNAVGGGIAQGVGVAGWLLGGGYSLKTNQYGLGIDNIDAFRVVLPNGDIVNVTNAGDTRDLYIALKGGGNNFGIVTQFTLNTYEEVERPYGGFVLIRDDCLDKFKDAVVKYIKEKNEPKASIEALFKYDLEGDEVKPDHKVVCFYDGSETSAGGLFDDFIAISKEPEENGSGSGLRERPYAELDAIFATRFDAQHKPNLDLDSKDLNASMKGLAIDSRALRGIGGTDVIRGRFGCIMVTGYTRKLVQIMADEATDAKDLMKGNGGKMVLFQVWPFLADAFKRNSTDAAWPHKDEKTFSPLIAIFLWDDEAKDDFWVKTMEDALDRIRMIAEPGCMVDNTPLYMNTCLERDADPYAVYCDDIDWLISFRQKYDPNGVMNNTGGVKIPLHK